MKKTLILVLIAVFVMSPIASFAKTEMSDSELSIETGQAGISINFSDIFNFSWGTPTNGTPSNGTPTNDSNNNHPRPIINFFKHFFQTITGRTNVPANGGTNVPGNGGSWVTIYAHWDIYYRKEKD